MEAKTRNRRRSSLASGGFADTRKVFVLIGDVDDREAACEKGKVDLVLDETKRLPCGKGGKRTLASSIRSKPRTTAFTKAICTDTRNFF